MGVYKKGKNWYIDYYCKGRRVRKKIGPSKQLAELTLKDVQLKIAKGEYLGIYEEKKIRFNDYAREYLEWSRTNKARSSYERDSFTVNVHLSVYFGSRWLFEIIPKMIEDYKTQRRKKVKASTVNRELDTLKNMLRKAQEWDYIKVNPSSGVRKLKQPAYEPQYLGKEQVATLLEACQPHLYAFIATAVNTGMRKSELFHLEWSDVDFKKRTITISNKTDRETGEDWHTKNYEYRVVPMNEFLYRVLKQHPRHKSSPYVFSNPDGSRFHDIRAGFGTALREAGLDHIPIHALRHTFASNLVMSGVDIRTVQKLMGHKDIKTTMRYAHLAPAHLRAAVETLSYGHHMDTKGHENEKSTHDESS